MIVLAGAIIGVLMGAWTAKKRGGGKWDIAQYAAGYGIAFTLLGLIITIMINRAAI